VRKFLLVTALVFLSAGTAMADLRIESSAGGRIGDYLELFSLVKQSGRRVIIDGPCLSACTLVTSIVPRGRICVTRRAVLGFHAAWHPDWLGRPQNHPRATELMLKTYPANIRRWIMRHGGLTERTILLRGPALYAMYRRCR
jgi:hypothetical protein